MEAHSYGDARKVELVCPAGSLPALKAAVDHGADCVYLGFRDGTNARNFPGLGFDNDELRRGTDYAHARGAKVFMAINTYPRPHQWEQWCRTIDNSARHDVDALILADPGLMQYAATRHPELRLHLSVQGSATNHCAINYFAKRFNVRRVVLPRVLSLTQVRRVIARTDIEVEVFGFGSLCVMVEGRCSLSSYVTGKSPNSNGVCSPAQAVRWETVPSGLRSYLNEVLIDEYVPGEASAYPTVCKGRYQVRGNTYHTIEEPTSLNVLRILPELYRAGVSAIKVEGRQRSPAYVMQVTQVLREAMDRCAANPDEFHVMDQWESELDRVAEGSCHNLGAYHRAWQ